MLKKVFTNNKSLASVSLIVLSVAIAKTISYLINVVFVLTVHNYLEKKSGPDIGGNSLEAQFKFTVEALVFAPLIETLVFQVWLIGYVFKGRLKRYAVVFSSLAFALTHYYSIYYIILSFLTGLVLSYAYVIARENNLKPSPFTIVFVIHFMYNFISFLVSTLE